MQFTAFTASTEHESKTVNTLITLSHSYHLETFENPKGLVMEESLYRRQHKVL